MFTADMARKLNDNNLDERIQKEVEYAISHGIKHAYLRVYIEDAFIDSIEEELTKRGFHSIQVPNITLKGDIYFSWE